MSAHAAEHIYALLAHGEGDGASKEKDLVISIVSVGSYKLAKSDGEKNRD